jgi:hypothetical protein
MEQEIVIGGDSADIPDGIYPAVVDRIEVMHSKVYDSDFRAWTFRIATPGEPGKQSEVSGSTSMATSSKSKGGKWIKTLLGRKPEKDERIKLSGLACQVRVEEGEDGWPKVTDVLPAVAATPTASVPDDLPF